MCAAQVEGAPAVKERRRKETSLVVLRHSHPRAVEKSIRCKTIQLDHPQMCRMCVSSQSNDCSTSPQHQSDSPYSKSLS